MKRMFPVGLLGYPWSKLVAEQAVLFAGLAGLPVALFRLPQTGLASTGFAQPNDIIVRIFSSVNDVRVVPTGFVFQSPHEGRRRPDPNLPRYLAESTAPVHHLSVQRYKPGPARLQARGVRLALSLGVTTRPSSVPAGLAARRLRSPVTGRCWITLPPTGSGVAGSGLKSPFATGRCAKIVHGPSSGPGRSPNMCATTTGSAAVPNHGRIRCRRTVAWNTTAWSPRPGTMRRTRASPSNPPIRTGCFVPWERQVRAIKAPEAGIQEDKLGFVVYDICRLLRNNAYRAKERQRFPQINDQKIVRPVFIVGMNRTGTTYLHRLLARAGRFQVLRSFELVEPVLRSGNYAAIEHYSEDPRRTIARDTLGASGMAKALEGVHQVGIDEPEEDFPILRHAFASWISTIRYRLPEFETWLLEAGCRDAYAYHHRTMQQYTWHRSQTCPGRSGTLALQDALSSDGTRRADRSVPGCPLHPDTPRARAVMGSWNSLVERCAPSRPQRRSRNSWAGSSWRSWRACLNGRSTSERLTPSWSTDGLSELLDMVEDPMAVVAHIYDRFGWPLEEDAWPGWKIGWMSSVSAGARKRGTSTTLRTTVSRVT